MTNLEHIIFCYKLSQQRLNAIETNIHGHSVTLNPSLPSELVHTNCDLNHDQNDHNTNPMGGVHMQALPSQVKTQHLQI